VGSAHQVAEHTTGLTGGLTTRVVGRLTAPLVGRLTTPLIAPLTAAVTTPLTSRRDVTNRARTPPAADPRRHA
jgi:hypothetical protein